MIKKRIQTIKEYAESLRDKDGKKKYLTEEEYIAFLEEYIRAQKALLSEKDQT